MTGGEISKEELLAYQKRGLEKYVLVHNVTGGEISKEELLAYQKRGLEKYGDKLDAIDIKLDGDEVELTYHLMGSPFERVRRITGYLVGTMNKWNDAKQAEERDRVKHEL